jgi:hypothetical protein
MRGIAIAILLGMSLAACGSSAPSASAPAMTPTPVPTAPATPMPTASTSGVPVDPSLLALLPPDVNGFAIVESPEAETSAAQSSDLSPVATSFAAGLAADSAGTNWAFGVVVALRPGVMSDAAFRTWRDSYDKGACSQAGGVVGHAETKLGGRLAYIASCAASAARLPP